MTYAELGSSILEVPGPENTAGADRLSERLVEDFRGTDVKVSRPVKCAEARISGLGESVTAEAVAASVAGIAGCRIEAVPTGVVRRSASRLGTVWLRYPVAAMTKLMAAGCIRVGWTSARVEALAARPQRCFKCLELGHVQQKCPTEANRRARCYTCGSTEHMARQCTASPKCPLARRHRREGGGKPAFTRGVRPSWSGRLGNKGTSTEANGEAPGRRARTDGRRIRPWGGHGHGIQFTPTTKILQANLNHSAVSQDLLQQTLAELGLGLAVVAEPYRVLDRPNWAGDALGSVAIIADGSAALCTFAHGRGYVAATYDGLAVVGIYAPPSAPLATFERLLDEVRDVVSRSPVSRTPVLGDFNAKSTAWGCPGTDARGETVLEWATGAGLLLLNRGSASTCVPWQGESIVDLSWATPCAARCVTGWTVADEVESLSDHLHVLMHISAENPHPARRPRGGQPPRRWAASLAMAWPEPPAGLVADVDSETEWFWESLAAVCDAAMPRTGKPRKRAVYWWSGEIAALRDARVAVRRRYTRARRRANRDAAREEMLYEDYRQATVALQAAIKKAKSEAWRELLDSAITPCGTPGHGESRPTPILRRIVDTLFSVDPEEPRPPESADPTTWSAELGVSQGEFAAAVRRLGVRDTAPGPDGVPGPALKKALRVPGSRLLSLFNGCLQSGRVPLLWK
ncbi:uncharacterized protein LOC143179691 [Calliopsis andreniformis]|uniref:uncharacterized protein LOC143179691 n=1 Tax=Calliopsis andreniformis TaxID=337506 RepID=UPI003FCDF444